MGRAVAAALTALLGVAAAAGAGWTAVEIVRPPAGVPLVGLTEVEIRVAPPPPAAVRVALEIDGRAVGEWRRPPYVVRHDFGTSGAAVALVARVTFADGSVAETRRESPPIRIDERVDLELQQLYVTVEDRRGRRRLDLTRDDFEIVDGGRPQEIVTFAAGNIPFTATLLIDASGSMLGRRLASALDGAGRFVAGMRDLDRARLVAFSDRVLASTPVGSRAALAAGFRDALPAGGGTALRDHLFVALRLLEERQGRRAVVLLSDGWDQLSVLASEQLWSAAERAQSTLHWVRLAGDEPTPARRAERSVVSGADLVDLRIRFHPSPSSWADEDAARRAYRRLEELVEMTGGRIFTVDAVDELQEAMAQVLAELHGQYALGYYPRPRASSGEWRPVTVRLARGGLEARARSGYVER